MSRGDAKLYTRGEASPRAKLRAAARRQQADGIKRTQLLTICVAQLNEAIQITMPYTVAVYMVRDFESRKPNAAPDEQRVGNLTGILAACFCAAQFVSSFPWGRASDLVGRKPMLVMSNLSSCVSVIGFGLSNDFLTAALLRLAGGFFNCTFVCLKSMIGESCETSAQAKPLSILSLCWGLGTVIGPSLGGVLSKPCDTLGTDFMLCGPGEFLQARPFFLPCGVVGMVSFLALLSSLFCMEETLPRLVAKKYAALSLDDDLVPEAGNRASHLSETELTNVTQSDPLMAHSLDSRNENDEEKALELYAPTAAEGQRDPAVPAASQPSKDQSDGIRNPWDKRVWEGQERSDFLRRNDTASLMAPTTRKTLAEPYKEPSMDENAALLRGTAHAAKAGPSTESSAESSDGDDEIQEGRNPMPAGQLAKSSAEDELDVKWYRNRQVLLTMFGYAMICLLYNLMDEVTPIYGSAARSTGGLGLSTSQLALPLALGGVAIFVWSMFFFPWFQQLLGVVRTCRSGILLTMPLCLGLALPSLLPLPTLGLQLLLAAVLCLKNVMATNSFTASVMMVNATAPQRSMGAVNGASQAAASFVRAIGPALGGAMWALSISLPFAGHQVLPFAATAVGFAAPLVVFGFVTLPAPGVEAAWKPQAASHELHPPA